MSINTVEQIQAQYAQEASTYRNDALKVNYEFDKFWEYLKSAIGGIFRNHQHPLKVLDLGAGTGMLTERLLQEYPNAHVTMLDFSKEMLAQGKSYFTTHGLDNGNIEWVCSNFITDEFPNEKYDLIISSYALHHVRTPEDLSRVYGKIATALQEDYGTFFCIDLFLGNNEQERQQQVEKLRNKLREHFQEDKVKQWLDLIRAEDTPATLYLTHLTMRGRDDVNQLLGRIGEMTVVYGMTKIPSRCITTKNIVLYRMYHRPPREFEFETFRTYHLGQFPTPPEDSEIPKKKKK